MNSARFAIELGLDEQIKNKKGENQRECWYQNVATG
jgi:hypothetical protein